MTDQKYYFIKIINDDLKGFLYLQRRKRDYPWTQAGRADESWYAWHPGGVGTHWYENTRSEEYEYKQVFTESEIKELDERYLAFAVDVKEYGYEINER